MKNQFYSASSCAVDNTQDKIRLTLQFMHFAEYNAAFENFENKSDLFTLDKRPRSQGGCSGGSKIVVLVDPDFARAAGEEMGSFNIRREISYINGAITRCDTVSDAIRLALDHA